MYDLPHTLDDDTYIADPRHPARLPKPSPQNLRKEARASQIRTARSAVRSCQRRGWDPGDIAKESYREMRARLGKIGWSEKREGAWKARAEVRDLGEVCVLFHIFHFRGELLVTTLFLGLR